jgi:hypothetical protein
VKQIDSGTQTDIPDTESEHQSRTLPPVKSKIMDTWTSVHIRSLNFFCGLLKQAVPTLVQYCLYRHSICQILNLMRKKNKINKTWLWAGQNNVPPPFPN